jgi:hypothetical protein
MIIDYYTKNEYLMGKYFKDYYYSVYNDIGNSVLVLSMNKSQSTNTSIVLGQKVLLSSKYNFIIENNINGKYRETNLNTNIIVLRQNKLLNLDVFVGDKILIRNQRFDFFNGEYEVIKVNKYIHMRRDVHLLPQYHVCMDENMQELSEYQNKESCEHENDLLGVKKQFPSNWDARCRRNMECPFFNEDEDYSGQCAKGGACVMPHDVKQIAFTKYKKIVKS